MANGVPFLKAQTNILYMLPQIALLVSLFVLFDHVDSDFGFIYGAITYLLISFSLKIVIPKSHRMGIKLIKQGKFEDAIVYFKQSSEFFTNKAWVDKYRYITLLSSSKRSYREMSLCNEAFSLTQIQRGAEAKKIYKQVVAEYPDSSIAPTALRTLSSF